MLNMHQETNHIQMHTFCLACQAAVHQQSWEKSDSKKKKNKTVLSLIFLFSPSWWSDPTNEKSLLTDCTPGFWIHVTAEALIRDPDPVPIDRRVQFTASENILPNFNFHGVLRNGNDKYHCVIGAVTVESWHEWWEKTNT